MIITQMIMTSTQVSIVYRTFQLLHIKNYLYVGGHNNSRMSENTTKKVEFTKVRLNIQLRFSFKCLMDVAYKFLLLCDIQ